MKLKTKVLVFLNVLLIGSYAFSQRGVRIAYVDMEYILENVEEYRDATEQLSAKVEKWKIEVEQKQSVVKQLKQDLMAEKVLLTPELIAEREEDILILEKEMIAYQQDRFGPQGDLVLQKQRLVQPIQDQVFNEVQKLGANKKYDFIFDKSADVVMLYSEKRHDISDMVLRGIARTRKISAPRKKASDRARVADFEAEDAEDVEDGQEEEVVSDVMQDRLEKAKEATEAREKTAEARRAEQLKLREERKKAYEERRKKLLEEREAKRSGVEEVPATKEDKKD